MMFDKKFARFRNFTSRDDGIGMADDESDY
jgi:hypothetical protein